MWTDVLSSALHSFTFKALSLTCKCVKMHIELYIIVRYTNNCNSIRQSTSEISNISMDFVKINERKF